MPRPRRPVLWPLAVLAVALVAGGLAIVMDTDGDADGAGGSAGDTVVDGPGLERVGSGEVDGEGTFEIGLIPSTYRITYRVRLPGTPPTTEIVWVRRPFESRVEVHAGTSERSELISVQEASFGHLAVASEGQDPAVTVVGPALASPDLRIDVAWHDALERGLLERRERRRVAGRECQVYRAGSSVTAGQLVAPTNDEYADACFDTQGLLLEEWWVTAGRTVRQRVAVTVEPGAAVADGQFTLPRQPTIPVDEGGGGMRAIAPGSAPPGEFFEVDSPPPGMEHLGRYSLVPSQPRAFRDPTEHGNILATTVDVWQAGPDFVAVDQGGTSGSAEVYAPAPDVPHVELGDIGEGELHVRLDRNEVRIHLDGNRFVRVYGTVPMDALVDVARSLRRIEGQGIEPLDGQPGSP